MNYEQIDFIEPHHLKDGICAIEFPADGTQRWRKIVRRSGTRPTGKFPSTKLGRMVQWESRHELNAFRLLEADPTVQTYCEQPVKITYILDGERHYHIPDILVRTTTGDALWEVKTEADAAHPDVLKRTNFMARHLPEHGYLYQTVLADDLAQQPRLDMICDVLHFGRDDIPVLERERIRNLYTHSLHPITWGAVVNGVIGRRSRYHFCRLMLDGSIIWNPNVHLTRDTVLFAHPLFAQSAAAKEA